MAGQARTLKAALEHRIGVRVPLDARIVCWLVEIAAQRRKDAAAQIHASQASKRRKVGPTILSRSVRWNMELVVGSSGCHRARIDDQNTCRERHEDS